MQTKGIFYIFVVIYMFVCNGQTHLVRLFETNNKTDNVQSLTRSDINITDEKSTIRNARVNGETASEMSNIQPTKSNKGTATELSKVGLIKSGKKNTAEHQKMVATKLNEGTVREQIDSLSPKPNGELPNFHDSFFLRGVRQGDGEAIEDFLRYHSFVDTPFDILRQILGIQNHLKINQIPDFSDVLRGLIVRGDQLTLAGKKHEVGDGRLQGLSDITFNKQGREQLVTDLQREHSALRTGSKFMKFLTQLRNSMKHTRQRELIDSEKLRQEINTSLNKVVSQTASGAMSNESQDLSNNDQRSNSKSMTLNVKKSSILENDTVFQKIGRFSELTANISRHFAEQNTNNKAQLKSSVIVQPDDERVIQFVDNILARENAVKSDIHDTGFPSGSNGFQLQHTSEGITNVGNEKNRMQNKFSSTSQISTLTDKRDAFSSRNETTNRNLAPQKRFPVNLETETTESQSSSKIPASLPVTANLNVFITSPTFGNASPVTTRSPASGTVTKVLHWPPIKQQQKFDHSRFAVSVSSEVVTSTPWQGWKTDKVSLPLTRTISRPVSKVTPRIVTKILQWPNLDTQRKSNLPAMRLSPTTIFSTTPTSLTDTLTTSHMFNTTPNRWHHSTAESTVSGQLLRGRDKHLVETDKNSEVPQDNMLSVVVNRDRKINKDNPKGNWESPTRPRLVIWAKDINKGRERPVVNISPVEAGRLNSFIIPHMRRTSTLHTTGPAKVTSSFEMLNSVQSPRSSIASLWDGFDLAWLDFFTKVWCDDSAFNG